MLRIKQELCSIVRGGRTPAQVRLLVGDTPLVDGATLAASGVENDTLLYMVFQKEVLSHYCPIMVYAYLLGMPQVNSVLSGRCRSCGWAEVGRKKVLTCRRFTLVSSEALCVLDTRNVVDARVGDAFKHYFVFFSLGVFRRGGRGRNI